MSVETRSSLRFAAVFTAAVMATTALSPAAHAQQTLPPSQPPSGVTQAPSGGYIAPVQQQPAPVQQVYVTQAAPLAGPRVIKDYDDGEPVPPGYHPETKIRTGLVVGGAVTFGVLYLISALVAAAISDVNRGTGHDGDDGSFLYVPVAGPFLQMTKTDSSTANVFLGIDGIAQAAGATMLVVGLTSPKTVLVRNDIGEVRLMPMRMGQGGGGLGLGGTF